MYVRLVEALRATRAGDARRALSRMRLFCSGSAPLSPETFAAFHDLAGHEILERYGMTETGMNLSNPYTGERRPGTVGTPLPGVSIRIVDAAGEEVPLGEAGLLLVRGSNVCDGYWRAPEKTRESFTTDELGRRWFRTGDLARQDPASGHVTLLGRESELVISGGFNIYPREVEEVLTGLPGVLEAAVVGAPDAEWGEVPVAFVVAGPELPERDRERLGEVLAERCRAQIAAFKVPKRFHRLEALPRNALGKVQKHLLREPVGTP
jgi:malonyl-CoA/methylmalonyl-CoA synthetase